MIQRFSFRPAQRLIELPSFVHSHSSIVSMRHETFYFFYLGRDIMDVAPGQHRQLREIYP